MISKFDCVELNLKSAATSELILIVDLRVFKSLVLFSSKKNSLLHWEFMGENCR